jgi:hypothetical protein
MIQTSELGESKMKGFPNGLPPQIAVKEMDLLWTHPDYETNRRIVHWSGGLIEEGDITIDEILEAIKEKNNGQDLAVWANREKNTFTIAWVDQMTQKTDKEKTK